MISFLWGQKDRGNEESPLRSSNMRNTVWTLQRFSSSESFLRKYIAQRLLVVGGELLQIPVCNDGVSLPIFAVNSGVELVCAGPVVVEEGYPRIHFPRSPVFSVLLADVVDPHLKHSPRTQHDLGQNLQAVRKERMTHKTGHVELRQTFCYICQLSTTILP